MVTGQCKFIAAFRAWKFVAIGECNRHEFLNIAELLLPWNRISADFETVNKAVARQQRAKNGDFTISFVSYMNSILLNCCNMVEDMTKYKSSYTRKLLTRALSLANKLGTNDLIWLGHCLTTALFTVSKSAETSFNWVPIWSAVEFSWYFH